METLDNRLDFITDIEEVKIQAMTEVRNSFIDLDSYLREQLGEDDNMTPAAARTLELARTHLEISLQFTIKTLCLLGEK